MATPRGIDVRQSGSGVLIRVALDDANGNPIATGSAALRLLEYQADGSFKQADFGATPGTSPVTFKTAGFTSGSIPLNPQAAPDGTVTGLWTAFLTNAVVGAAMTPGNLYLGFVSHSQAGVLPARREFQYGGGNGDDVPQSGDAYARLGAPSGASTAADISSVAAAVGAVATTVTAENTSLGQLVASVGTGLHAELDAVKAVTDAVAPLIVGGKFTVAALSNAPSASAVTVAGYQTGMDPASQVLTALIETGVSLKQAIAHIGAMVGGKLTGADTPTITVFAMGNPNTPRATVATDTTGRTQITMNLA